jgi:hypothetical protein
MHYRTVKSSLKVAAVLISVSVLSEMQVMFPRRSVGVQVVILTSSGKEHSDAVLTRLCLTASRSSAVLASSLAFAGFFPACPRRRSSALLLRRQPLGSGML